MAFNGMTDQLSSLIATLEARVAERTRALERRLNQLQVTAQVAGEAAGISRVPTSPSKCDRLDF